MRITKMMKSLIDELNSYIRNYSNKGYSVYFELYSTDKPNYDSFICGTDTAKEIVIRARKCNNPKDNFINAYVFKRLIYNSRKRAELIDQKIFSTKSICR